MRLLLAGFVETPGPVPEVASTLIHQILSVIAERGGIRPRPLFDLLCGPGPFSTIGTAHFADLLRHMGSPAIKLVEQAPDGIMMLGEQGERIVQSRGFFAVFETAEEWRLTVGGRALGTLPISFPVHKASLVVFAGQRWIVQDLDEKTKTLFVSPHPGGVVPRFERVSVEPADDRLAAEMRAVYLSSDVPAYLDAKAKELLADGRETFRALGLEQESFVTEDRDVHVFLWRGSQATAVFGAALAMAGLAAEVHDFGVTLEKTGLNEILPILTKLGAMASIDPSDMAEFVQNINAGKYRDFVPDGLARSQWARQNAPVVSRIPEIARGVLPPNSTQEDE
jgi:ATP-dependent Lhr-like helicase